MPPPEPVLAPPPEPVPFSPDPRAETPAAAEAIVVGAGILGASTAWHLARAGMSPLVIEANLPGWGASGHTAGLALAGLGGRFPDATRAVREVGGRSILEYTARSIDLLEAWEAELRGGLDWDRSGSLVLALDEAEEVRLGRMAEIQAAEGLEVRILDGEALRDLAPGLAVEEVRAATWTPRDGTLDPSRLCGALVDAVREMGGTVVTGVRVERLLARGGRTSGVLTSHGEVAGGAVLLAAGAWTPSLAPHLATTLTAIRETVVVTEALPFRIGEAGFETSDGRRSWRQARGGEVVIGGVAVADEAERVPASSTHSTGLLARLHPPLRDARIIRRWRGLLDVASLDLPMAGPLPAEDGTPTPGAWVAAGLGRHGHAYAPILGRLLAEAIAGAAPSLSLAPFDPRRPAFAGPPHPVR